MHKMREYGAAIKVHDDVTGPSKFAIAKSAKSNSIRILPECKADTIATSEPQPPSRFAG